MRMNTDLRGWLSGAVGIVLLAASTIAAGATEIPRGKWSFVFKDSKGQPDKPIRVYTYRPQKCEQPCTLVFSIHGVSRTASNYRDYWESAADRYNLVIVAPEFSKKDWDHYNEVDVNKETDREKWAFSVIEHLFDEVGEGRKDYVIFGHSAGGQFVHRMAYFMPDSRARLMIAANPGWYMWPEWRKDKGAEPFPYSLLETQYGEAAVRQALQRPFILALGDKDIDPNHKDLRKSAAAMKQGATRFERGENYFKAATAAASELGVKLNWQLLEVPGVAHQAGPMSRASADLAFGKQ
jgi:poly(3-hydroxybutyrate) depolymerase